MTTIDSAAPATMRPGVDDHFGLCPKCVEAGEFDSPQIWLNVRKAHYVACEKHQVHWHVGSNLFSSWRFESEEDWQRNTERLNGMAELEPRYLPETEATFKKAELREGQLRTLFRFLSEPQKDLVLSMLCELSDCVIEGGGITGRNSTMRGLFS